MNRELILIGASVRSLAESAIALGFAPLCLDQFADADLLRLLERNQGSYLGRFSCAKLVPELLAHVDPSVPVLWAGGVENAMSIVSEMRRQRQVFGPNATAVAMVRSIDWMRSVLSGSGLQIPSTMIQPDALCEEQRVSWIWKPVASAGGLRICPAATRSQVDADCPGYYQERIDGVPFSVLYSARSTGLRRFGASIVLSGIRTLGATGFEFCGNIGPVSLPARLAATLDHAVRRLVEGSGYSGVLGVDLILKDSSVWLLEVNPRITASHWLYELAKPGCVLAEAINQPAADDTSEGPCDREATRFGIQLIPWAERCMLVGNFPQDATQEFNQLRCADRPEERSHVAAGTPFCSVLASGGGTREILKPAVEMVNRLMGSDSLGLQNELHQRLDAWDHHRNAWTA